MTKRARKSYRLSDLVAHFGGEIRGDDSTRIFRISTLDSAAAGDLSFLTNSKYRHQLDSTKATAVILDQSCEAMTTLPRIVCNNPYAYYARVSSLINPPRANPPGIHEQANVAPGVRLGSGVYVGPYANIAEGVEIENDVQIGAGCYIGRNVFVGSHSVIHANVTVYDDCVIGQRSILHSGVIIGADGFGMAMDQGQWIKIPQIGRVIMGADVEIGANTTIDRGALDDTIIEDDVKMDNQIQIGHNCHIGAHTAIAGCAGIAGSVRIGRYCRIGGSAMIIGHLEIADNVEISAGTLVPKSIRKPGKYTAVFPISEHDDWSRNASLIRHLKELRQKIRALEQPQETRKNR